MRGSHCLKLNGKLITIFRYKKTKEFKVVIDGIFGNKSFKNLSNAKIAAFNGVEYLKDTGKWESS